MAAWLHRDARAVLRSTLRSVQSASHGLHGGLAPMVSKPPKRARYGESRHPDGAGAPSGLARGSGDHQQLIDLHRGPYVSQSALASILSNIKDHGLPSAFSRQTQARVHADVGDTMTPYGRVCQDMELPLTTGPVVVGVQAPIPMIWLTARESLSFRSLLAEILTVRPNTRDCPWRLVIYFDGISPNDALSKGKDKRKVNAFYYSFLEFGFLLCDETLWWCASATRDIFTSKLEGKMSCNCKLILGRLFFGEDFDLRRHGVTVDISVAGDDSRLVTLYVDHEVTIADGLAIEEVSLNKGHSGSVPCPICRNVTDAKRGYHETAASEGKLFPTTSLEPGRWKRHTDESLRRLILRLQDSAAAWRDGTITKAKHEELLQIHGYKYSPEHIVLDSRLRYKAISSLFFDTMHVWCIDGIFERELRATMQAIQADSTGREPMLSWSDMDAYLQRWSWPKQFASGANVCETKTYQATASETLSACPVLAHMFRQVFF